MRDAATFGRHGAPCPSQQSKVVHTTESGRILPRMSHAQGIAASWDQTTIDVRQSIEDGPGVVHDVAIAIAIQAPFDAVIRVRLGCISLNSRVRVRVRILS